MESTPISSDDTVTISEALKRLGNQAPARQSFHAAVTNGKIQKVLDTTDASDGKIRVLWASVQTYIASGGFKQSQKAAVTTGGQTETTSTETGPEVPDSPAADSALETGHPQPPKLESPSIINDVTGDAHPIGNRLAKHRHPLSAKGKREQAPPRERTDPKGKEKSEEGGNSKGRRNLSLRVIKNGLRHLGFEQTKAIRDWADNRLLTVLRPTQSLIEASLKVDAEQPA